MIILSKNKVLVDKSQLINTQKDYQERKSFVIPSFLDPCLRPLLDKHLFTAEYTTKIHNDNYEQTFAKEHTVNRDNMTDKILNLYLNNSTLIDVIKLITQSNEIQSVNSRVYKFEDDDHSFDTWHSDVNKNNTRILGFSINLSARPYQGGSFLLIEKQTKKIYRDLKHDMWGGAHFFMINPELNHMVTRVKGNNPRTVCAGWFEKEENRYKNSKSV